MEGVPRNAIAIKIEDDTNSNPTHQMLPLPNLDLFPTPGSVGSPIPFPPLFATVPMPASEPIRRRSSKEEMDLSDDQEEGKNAMDLDENENTVAMNLDEMETFDFNECEYEDAPILTLQQVITKQGSNPSCLTTRRPVRRKGGGRKKDDIRKYFHATYKNDSDDKRVTNIAFYVCRHCFCAVPTKIRDLRYHAAFASCSFDPIGRELAREAIRTTKLLTEYRRRMSRKLKRSTFISHPLDISEKNYNHNSHRLYRGISKSSASKSRRVQNKKRYKTDTTSGARATTIFNEESASETQTVPEPPTTFASLPANVPTFTTFLSAPPPTTTPTLTSSPSSYVRSSYGSINIFGGLHGNININEQKQVTIDDTDDNKNTQNSARYDEAMNFINERNEAFAKQIDAKKLDEWIRSTAVQKAHDTKSDIPNAIGLECEMEEKALCLIVRRQLNYSLFEHPEFEELLDAITKYVILRRTAPDLPTRFKMRRQLLPQRVRQLQLFIDEIVVQEGFFETVLDEAKKSRIDKWGLIIVTGLGIKLLVALEDETRDLTAATLTSRVADRISNWCNGNIFYINSMTDSCKKMCAVRAKLLQYFGAVGMGCGIHWVQNIANRLNGLFSIVTAAVYHIIDVIFNTTMYVFVLEIFNLNILQKPMYCNSLQWSKFSHCAIWILEHLSMIKTIVSNEATSKWLTVDEINLWKEPRTYIEIYLVLSYHIPLHKIILSLMKEHSGLSEVFLARKKLETAYSYKKLHEHHEELNDILLDQLSTTKNPVTALGKELYAKDGTAHVDNVDTPKAFIYSRSIQRDDPKLNDKHEEIYNILKHGVATSFIHLRDGMQRNRCIFTDYGVIICGTTNCALDDIVVADIPNYPLNEDEIKLNQNKTLKERIAEAEGHYCIELEPNILFGAESTCHERVCDDLWSYGLSYYSKHIMADILPATFAVNIKYREYPMSDEDMQRVDAFYRKWFGACRIRKCMRIINTFRGAIGIFNQGEFDVSTLSEKELLDLDPKEAWLSVFRSNGLRNYAKTFVMLLTLVGSTVSIENVWRYWNTTTSFHRNHKSAESKMMEMYILYNERQLKEYGYL